MKKILLIEANKKVAAQISEILEMDGYKVTIATDGRQGFAAAVKEIPDLIICDVLLPVLDGYGVLKLLNHEVSISLVPFIFLISKNDREEIRRCMNLGADDFLFKPVDVSELLEAVKARLKVYDEIKTKINSGPTVDERDSSDMLDLTSGNRVIRHYAKKQIVFDKGDRVQFLHFIISGSVKEYLFNEQGKEIITSLQGPGDFIGYTSILKGNSYYNSAAALSDADVMLIPRNELAQILEKDSEFSNRLLGILTNDVKERDDQLLNMAYTSARKRVADALLKYVEKLPAHPADNGVAAEINRADLASFCGLTKESTVRVLTNFKEENLIEVADNKIVLLDKSRLMNVRE